MQPICGTVIQKGFRIRYLKTHNKGSDFCCSSYASLCRIGRTIERHGELWHHCYVALMEQTQLRLEQEVRRLGGNYAHVLAEHIDSRRDEANGQSWLHGRFNYVLYRRPGPRLKDGPNM